MSNSRAVERLIKNASNGDIESMYRLAMRYYNGNGTDQSFDKSLIWLFDMINTLSKHFSNLQDNELRIYVDSMIMIGQCFEKGQGVQQDFEKAFTWYRKGSEIGNINALFRGRGSVGTASVRARNKLIQLIHSKPELAREINIPSINEYEYKYGAFLKDVELEKFSGYSFYIEEFKKNNIFRQQYANGNIKIESEIPSRTYLIGWLIFFLIFCLSGGGEFLISSIFASVAILFVYIYNKFFN